MAGVLVVVLGFVAALGGSALATELRALDGSLGSDFVGQALGSLAKTVLAILPYCASALVVALWTRSSAAGIAVPIIAFYAEVLLTCAWPERDVPQIAQDVPLIRTRDPARVLITAGRKTASGSRRLSLDLGGCGQAAEQGERVG